jgi:hypothetical protein
MEKHKKTSREALEVFCKVTSAGFEPATFRAEI